MVERYILPKLMAVAERGHSTVATITDSQYFGALTAEMDRWNAQGFQCYLRQPGVKLDSKGKRGNEQRIYTRQGEIHYTLDGSEPTRLSPRYTGPFKAKDAKEVRARLFMGPSWSVTSILFLD